MILKNHKPEQINLNNCSDDNELVSKLSKNKYEVIDFPGCVKDIDEYIEWHKTKRKRQKFILQLLVVLA